MSIDKIMYLAGSAMLVLTALKALWHYRKAHKLSKEANEASRRAERMHRRAAKANVHAAKSLFQVGGKFKKRR